MRVYFLVISLFLSIISPLSVQAHDIKIPTSIKELALTKIADNIYVVHGSLSRPNKDNKAFISNTGIIVTDQGVVVVDTGGSLQVGELVVKKIKTLTDKPIIAVFNTHVHGDHWLGNAAIRKAFPKVAIYAHQRTIEHLNNGEDQRWLDIMMNMTEKAVAGTTAVKPDKPLQGGENLNIAGAQFKIHYAGKAHTDTDIMIEYPGQQILFAGDIVQYGRIVASSSPQSFSATGQIDALKLALTLPVNTYVPGHGVTGGKEIPQATLRFLDTLYKSVHRYYKQGMQDFEMRDKVAKDLAEFSDWAGMDNLGRLISFIYQQVEADDFG